MKDYSEFIKNEYGFITNINIDKDNKIIEVMTSRSKKGQPHIYELTKERLDELYERLTNQYKLLIENSNEIYENKNKYNHIIIKTILVICLVMAIIFSIASLLSGKIALLLLPAGLVLTTVGIENISQNKQKKFNEMINAYNYFINNKFVIEDVVARDHNIQLKVNNKTAKVILQNTELKNEQLIDNIYDIQLMDKISLNELKNMLLRYKISTELFGDPYYECKSEEENKKKLKKIN